MISSNQKTDALRPVNGAENQNVNGEALIRKKYYDEHLGAVTSLRRRQETYEASLPKDPREALADIYRSLPDPADSSSSQHAVRSVLTLLEQISGVNGLDSTWELNQAIYWLVNQGLRGLKDADEATTRARDIAEQFEATYKPFKA